MEQLTETYRIDPEWGSLAAPLRRMLQKPNGVATPAVERLHRIVLDKLEQTAIPGRKNEDWKYTGLRDLLKTKFTEVELPSDLEAIVANHKKELDAHCLVFMNGQYVPSQSDTLPAGISVGPVIAVSRDKAGDEFLTRLATELETQLLSPFEALNAGMTTQGMCLLVAPHAQIEKPIHLLHIVAGAATTAPLCHPYKLIHVGRHARVRFVETFASDNTPTSLTNSVTHVIVEPGADCAHYRLHDESASAYHINMIRVFQDRDSIYTSFAVELGGKLTRNNVEVIHRGSGILSNVFGIFLADQQQHTDTQSFIDHAYPHCESHELYKGILDDNARGVFNGKIIVRPDAQKTNAFQQNNTLILSRDAVMDSKPQLEIFADDVKCSHGATIGQLDENAIFYLRSRGLNKHQASSLLQRAFVGEVLDRCKDDEIRTLLNAHIEAHYHG